MKRIHLILNLIGLTVVLLAGSIYLVSVQKAWADENVDLKIKLEASVDGGKTWHNYYGTTNSDGETVTAQPGDTVFLRLKTWNESETHIANDVQVLGTYTKYKYVAKGYSTNRNEDGNDNVYAGNLADLGVGLGTITVGVDGSESTNYESAILAARLKKQLPIGRTVLTAQIGIADEGTSQAVAQFLAPSYALADGYGNRSKVKVVVNVGEGAEDLPQTGGSSLR